jgi:hypothetical protein
MYCPYDGQVTKGCTVGGEELYGVLYVEMVGGWMDGNTPPPLALSLARSTSIERRVTCHVHIPRV